LSSLRTRKTRPFEYLQRQARQQQSSYHEAKTRIDNYSMQLRDALERVERNKSLYDLLAENIGEAISVINQDRTYAYFSPSWLRVLGVMPGKGFSLGEITHPEDHDRLIAVMNEAFETGSADTAPYRIIVPDTGELRWMRSSASGVRDRNGNVIKLITVTRDITDEHLQTQQWQAELERHRLLLGSTSELIAVLDADLSIRYHNAALERLFASRLEPAHLLSTIHPQDRPALEAAYHRLLDTGAEQTLSFRVSPTPHQQIWLRAVATPLPDSQGRLESIALIALDVSELLLAQETLAQSEQLYRQLAQDTPDHILIVQEGGQITYINAAALNFYGPPSPARLRDIEVLVHPDDLETIGALLRDCFLRKVPQAGFLRAADQQGAYRTFDLQISPISTADDKPAEFLLVARDRTELVQIRQELEHRERRFRQLANNSPDAITLFDLDGHAIYDNPSVARLFGAPRPLGRHFTYGLNEQASTLARQTLANALGDLQNRQIELDATKANGDHLSIHALVCITRGADDQADGFIVIRHDITPLKQALQELEKSERQFRSLIEQTNDFMQVIGADGSSLYRNPALLDFLGITEASEDALVGGAIHPDDRQKVIDNIGELLAGRGTKVGEYRLISPKTGKTHWVSASGALLRNSDGSVDQLFTTFRDITEVKETEEQRARSEQMFRSLIENMPGFVQIFDPEKMISIYDSPSLIAAAGDSYLQEALPFDIFIHPDDRAKANAAARACITTGDRQFETFRITFQPGQDIWVDASLLLLRAENQKGGFHDGDRLLVICHDITQLKRSEESMRQTQKLEAIGQLTGGLAHDFNNLLGIVIGNLDWLDEHLPDDPAVRKRLKSAIGAAERGAEVTRSLLSVARRKPMRPELHNINDLIAEMLPLLRTSAGSSVSLITMPSDTVLNAMVDPSGLNNAILNLVINARDALQDLSRAAQIVISSSKVSIDSRHGLGLLPGDYALIEIIDNGRGMPPEIFAQAFDPFFTTKERGRGTGLGLSMVLGMTEQIGGTAKIISTQGEGTTVRLYLPMPRASGDRMSADGRRKATALVVDDQADIAEITCQWLESAGFLARSASNIARARAVLETEVIDLLILPAMIPGSESALPLVSDARMRHPDTMILLTGSMPASLPDAVSEMRWASLNVPYRKQDLINTIDALQERLTRH
jgi:PAS domain S-box-containing protein